MRKTIVCIFAHPDDEAFVGPAGTITKLVKDHDVYLLCATKGEAGQNNTKKQIALEKIRAAELGKSAKILGIKKVYFLGFEDGTLCNNLYHDLAKKIEIKLKKLRPELIMTLEPQGVSGHIDHFATSMVTSYVFYKLPFIKTVWYHCVPDEIRQAFKDYFIYFPPGYKREEIDKVVNIRDVWEKKVQAMMVHQSQRSDAKKILKAIKDLPKEEYFLVVNK